MRSLPNQERVKNVYEASPTFRRLSDLGTHQLILKGGGGGGLCSFENNISTLQNYAHLGLLKNFRKDILAPYKFHKKPSPLRINWCVPYQKS